MAPALNRIDHIHVYVKSWHEAETCHREILGLERVEALRL